MGGDSAAKTLSTIKLSKMNNASEEVIEKFKKQSIDIKSSIEKIDQIIDTINR